MIKVRCKKQFRDKTTHNLDWRMEGNEWNVSPERLQELLKRDLVEQVDREKKEGVQAKEKVEVTHTKKQVRGKQ